MYASAVYGRLATVQAVTGRVAYIRFSKDHILSNMKLGSILHGSLMTSKVAQPRLFVSFSHSDVSGEAANRMLKKPRDRVWY